MTTPKDVNNKEEELITVDGLQFKRYIYDFMEVLAKAQKYRDVKDFIRGSEVLNIGAQLESLEANYADPILKKLDKERH